MENIKLTGPEAGIALSTLVAFSDDNPSEEEAAVIRKYYRFEDAESFQAKMDEAGCKYPDDISALEPGILETLKREDKDFQLRTLASALILAHADGVFDQNEMNVLNRFCMELHFSLHDADLFSKNRLKEIDEITGYSDFFDETADLFSEAEYEFTADEAGAALSIIVGFSDDDPSDQEAGVMREYFKASVISSLMSKMASAGLDYPESLSLTKESIFKAFERMDRDLQKKYLAIAYKVAGADGDYADAEIELILEYCLEYGIGIVELKEYFKTSVV